ncbi:hypothetical protein [Dyella acidisoli]|uniref:Lipoprotein n=1 Tax=Dyella acidisoli TaxID=1867834 RepID=A0ABQ5XHK9_9GAMM|nr:hypothetical protein [Dyella acidisoli]GLQ91175.1 hypothetical protein GCM10007901_01250 [Dyella acidisoli]
MKAFGKRIMLAAMVGTTTLSLIGCANTVTIHYNQSATCSLFDSNPTGSPHTTTQSSNGLFVIYKVTSVVNTSSGAQDFNFNPSKVYNGNQNFANNQSFDYLLQLAQPKTVAKGTTANDLGKLIIDTTADPNNDRKADFPLRYNSGQGESVLLVRDNPNTPPPFLDPCSPSNINSL